MKQINPYFTEIYEHQDIIILNQLSSFSVLEQLFSEKQPLILDIGCGAGNFLRDNAILYPQYNYLGFEVRYKRLVKAAIKFKKNFLNNIRLIKDRAENITAWLPPNSVQEIHINFPDPWSKLKQHKHRLLKISYLINLYKILLDGGMLNFKTDHQEYFLNVISIIKKLPSYFQIIHRTNDLYNSDLNLTNIPTEFEEIFKNQGLPVYAFKCQKIVAKDLNATINDRL